MDISIKSLKHIYTLLEEEEIYIEAVETYIHKNLGIEQKPE